MIKLNIEFVVPDNLIFEDQPVAIAPPKFHPGQRVVVPDDNEYPTDWLECRIAAPLLVYHLLTDNNLKEPPHWEYLIEIIPGHVQETRYQEKSFITAQEHKKVLQRAIDEEELNPSQIAQCIVLNGCTARESQYEWMGYFLDQKDITHERTHEGIAKAYYLNFPAS